MSGIRLGADFLSTYDEGIKKEWIIGNGLGGFASSTVINARTRTYHGLLVAAPENYPGRYLMLSSLDEEISTNEEIYKLATHKYPGTVSPEGFNYLSEFFQNPFPTWVYHPGGITVKKTVFMVRNSNTTCVLYDIKSRREEALLRIYPLVSSRDFNITARAGYLSFTQEATPAGVELASSNGFTFSLSSDLQYHPNPTWYYNLEYDAEKERGLNSEEDNFSPGYFESKIGLGNFRFFVAVSTGDISSLTLKQVDKLRTREANRQNLLVLDSKLIDPFALKLIRATDTFVVRSHISGEDTVIAGYHWYSDWGRDTMISLPGLLLVPYRFEEARTILNYFARYCRRGLIPNTFPAFGGEPIYNTVDAFLWFIHEAPCLSPRSPQGKQAGNRRGC